MKIGDKIVDMKTKTIQHINPIWGSKANFIIGIILDDPVEGYEVVWEQLWSKKITDYQFIICCIPFFARNLSLGDLVSTNDKYMITAVDKPSGQYTYRVWFGETKGENYRFELLEELNSIGVLLEWYSSNLLAISCPEHNAQVIADLLFKKQQLGYIYYETGKT